jgi:hypothetical protein
MCTADLDHDALNTPTGRAASASDDVAEVIATYGGRTVDVAHLGRANRSNTRKRAGILAGLGLAAMAGGLGLFAYESAQPWEAWSQAALEAQASGATLPEKPGLGTGGLGMGLALLGLVPFLFGFTRFREDETTSYGRDSYEIGESPDARMTVNGAGLPSAGNFPLVERDVRGVQINFGAEMRGAVTLGGKEHTFASLLTGGRAQIQGDHYQLTLPRGAKAVVEHGGLRFWVRSVDPATLEVERAPMDGAFWGYVGGAGAVAAAAIFMLHSIPDSMLSMSFEEETTDARYARYLLLAEPTEEPETVTSQDTAAGGDPEPEAGARAPGDEGKAGKPTSKESDKRLTMKKRGDIPSLARNKSYAQQASNAGVLGIMAQYDESLFAAKDGGVFSSGMHDEDIFGNLTGREVGEAHGVGGLAIVGAGPGGGGMATGVIGLSTAGYLQQVGDGNGKSLVRERGKTVGFKDREKRGPRVKPRTPVTTGDIDKQLIRRIVRTHINEVRSCYNAGLVSNPNLQGRVEVNFVIMGNGKVSSSVVSANGLGNRSVAQCIAKAVKRWHFPRRGSAGTVTVKYPFSLTKG